MSDLTKPERIKLIKKALEFCGQKPTPEAIKRQYEYETGEDYDVPHRSDPYEAGE